MPDDHLLDISGQDDTQYHMEQNSQYAKALQKSNYKPVPAYLNKTAGVLPAMPNDQGYYSFQGGGVPPSLALQANENDPRYWLQLGRHIDTQQATVQNAIPQDSSIRAQTWQDKLQDWRDSVGRKIAPLLGLNFDQMAQDESNGMIRAMIPFGPPSESGAKLLSTPVQQTDAGTNVMAQVVDPERIQLGNTWQQSLFIDKNGHVINVSPAIHGEAMRAIEPELYDKVIKSTPPQDIMSGKVSPFGEAMKKTGFTRVSYLRGAPLNVEQHTTPTPHQIESLTQLFESLGERARGSFDFHLGGKNSFANGVDSPTLMDKMFQFFKPKF